MKAIHSGFTLIELVVVIVILGILSAVALPKFINLSGEAGTAAASGVAASLASASAINYAARKVGNSNAVTVASCAATAGLLVGNLPNGYTVATTTACSAPDGGTAVCTVTHTQTTKTASSAIVCSL